MNRWKRRALQALTIPGLTRPFRPLMRGRASIFMLHRFAGPGGRPEGHDLAAVRKVLAYLRRERYELVPLDDLFRRLAGEGAPIERAVAFTIDDGYADHARAAGPLFAEFDAPVTVFATSGFLDGEMWFWWDRIEYVFHRTRATRLSVPLDGEIVSYEWANETERAMRQDDFTQRCKLVADAAKHEAIAALADAAGVELPTAAPEIYAPMTWAELRACEERGMSFGPHTVTHPVLSRTSAEQSRHEITRSWERLAAEAKRPVKVFCYPNGNTGDYGPREIATLESLGFLGAVVGAFGHADAAEVRENPRARFEVRRFADAESLPHVIQYVSGIEHLKGLLRGGAA